MTEDKQLELFCYEGEVDAIIFEELLSEIEKIEEYRSLETNTRKRIYSVIIELLTNLSKHNIEWDNKKQIIPSKFEIKHKNNHYEIIAGNTILNSKIEKIQQRFEEINALEYDEVRKLYINKVFDAEISDKGGAGLGLITIAKSSKNKFFYKFTKLNDEQSYMTIKINIS